MSDTVLETINSTVRDQFETSWLRGAPLRIEEALPDPAADGYLPTLEELVRIDMERTWETADAAAELPTVETYLARFPLLSEQRRLARLVRWEQTVRSRTGKTVAASTYATRFPSLGSDVVLVGDESTVRMGAAETLADAPWPRYAQPELGDFGNYELISKLGEGGMGVVYRARQKGADRIVALKVVHTNRAGSSRESTRAKALDRFRIEAKSAAQLNHENVVPVYDVGEIGDTLYFSMRLVEGRSLNDVVRDGPLEFRRAARYVVGAARGVAQAHRQGILHRDLKPHNVMLDEQNDRPLVADFGLAKAVEADDQVTRSGEVIGTPSYMPPEQISSAADVTPLADVYALGATLYHLIVGRPPFQAANTLATMRQVLYQEPVPPRELNAAIDADLNTICIKCLQKEPGKRYASADDLADDLQRYLDGMPIAARPIGALERIVRWGRRNPLAAGLAGIAALLAVGVLASTTIGYLTTSAALAQSDRNYALARQSVDELYTDVSEIDLEDAPGMQPLKVKLLTRSLGYYERLVADHKDDAEATAELAANNFRVASIKDQLGDPAAALARFSEAQRIQSLLLAQTPGDRSLELALSDTWNELGRVRQRTGDLAAAGDAYRRAEELRAALVEKTPQDGELRRKLANVRMNRGLLAVREGRYDDAARLYAQARAERQLIPAEASPSKVAEDNAKGAFNEGVLAANQKQFPAAVERFQSAVQQFAALLAAKPTSLKYRYRLATAQFMLADAQQLAGEADAALDSFAQAQTNLQSLIDENPLVADYQQQLTTMQLGQAQLALRLGHDEARAAVDGGDPQGARAQTSERYFRQAQATLELATARLRKLLSHAAPDVSDRYNLAAALQMAGDVRLAFDDAEAARTLLVEAQRELARVPAAAASTPAHDELRAAIERSLAELDAEK